MCGPPGAGTTTRATELSERFAAVRMRTDDWIEHLGFEIRDESVRERIDRLQGDLTSELLRVGTNVVVEWGARTRAERDGLRERAMTAGALVHLEFLDPQLGVVPVRVADGAREQQVGSRAITPEGWSTVIERPTQDEVERYDPMPPVVAGDRPGSPAYPYGSWQPWSRPR